MIAQIGTYTARGKETSPLHIACINTCPDTDGPPGHGSIKFLYTGSRATEVEIVELSCGRVICF